MIALLLIGLVVMTRRNVPNVSKALFWEKKNLLCNTSYDTLRQIYKTYSMMAGLLVTIAIGFLIVLILGVILITITFWFDKDPGNVKEVQMSKLLATTVKVEDPGFNLDLATALKALIMVEGSLYVIINVRMLKKWVSF